MAKQKTDKHYVSTVDQFLEEKRGQVSLSDSQRAEIAKYQRLNELRDNKSAEGDDNKLWKDF